MPLVDLLCEKWRIMRVQRARGEESRRKVFESLNAQEKDRACQEIIRWLKQADRRSGNPENSDDWYYSEAQKRIAGFRWQLHRLNRPFIWLEKNIIESLDFWSDRANLFQFFSKVSPVIEAIGVLAIPFVIFFYESQREEQQITFQENLISAQAEVRQQQAVRDYLSQITTIYLDVKGRDDIKQNEDLKNLLEATTLAIFDELSVSEDFGSKSSDSSELNEEAIKRDRKGEVIDFLSKLGWINSLNSDDEPLLLLSESNLSQADLRDADLRGAVLRDADLRGAVLRDTDLRGADLRDADLRGGYLRDADLRGGYLRDADLRGADLRDANLSGADLIGADLRYVDLMGADLIGSDLRYVDLMGGVLIGADLRYADLSRAVFCKTIMSDGSINNNDCKTLK